MGQFSQNEKINIAYKLYYQIAGTANDAPGAAYWYSEQYPWSPVIPLNKIWSNFYQISGASTPSQADAVAASNPDIEKVIVPLTLLTTSNNRAYIAKSGTTLLDNWIQPSLIRTSSGETSVGYAVALYNGNPLSVGVALPTSYHSNVGDPSWSFNYSSGMILISGDESAHYKTMHDSNGLYIVGYRYVGPTGGGGGASYLDNLLDVTITSPVDNDILFYSAGTWINKSMSGLTTDLSNYLTSAQTYTIFYTSAQTNELFASYYTSAQTDALFTGYYTSAQTNVLLISYYTSAQTNNILLDYYTSAQTDDILLGYVLTSKTYSLNDLTNVSATTVTDGQVLTYSAGTWINSTIKGTDLSGYYTSAQTNGLLTGITANIEYTNTSATTQALGGIPQGSIFSNVSMQQMWDRLLYPYQTPAFSSFSISGLATSYEVGYAIPNSGTFIWGTTNSVNVSANTITIAGNSLTTLSNLANDNSEAFTFDNIVSGSSYTTKTWTINGTNTNNVTITQASFSITWKWRFYWGIHINNTLNETEIKGLISNALQTTYSGTYSFPVLGYKYICYPNVIGGVTSFKNAANGIGVQMADINDGYTNSQNGLNYMLVSVTNTYGVTTDYRVYRTKYVLNGSISIIVA